MFLKELDVFGFKSFGDRVRVSFEPGLTVIVGPNGSGKSNLAEAIRWVLGEQNPRELRGVRMEDVIFAGSPRRRGLGLAEVSLTLDNGDGFLPLDFLEVTLSRSVDRSGVSEYRLNRTVVRQRDVAALLAGTGVGRQAYAYVAQGRVDEILDARPEERRLVFEEAAGLTAHRQRREESLRLLRQSDAHLTRLRDILSETERHLLPLREEAERALRHRALSAALREVEERLLAGRARSLRRRLEALRAEIARLEAERARAGEELTRSRARWERSRGEAEALEAAIVALTRDAGEAARQAERARGCEARARELREVADDELAGLARELAESRRRREECEREQAEESAALARLEEAAEERRRRVSAAEAELARLEARHAELTSGLRRLQDELFEVVSAAARARNEAAAAERERGLLERERERLEREEAALRDEQRRLQERLAALQEEAARREGEAAAARRRREEAARERDELERAAADLEQRWERVREEARAAGTRLELLRQLEASHEGYARGPRAVLEGRRQGHPAYRGVVGAVATLLRPRPGMATAIEAALGPAAQYLVVEREEDARRAIEQLKADRAGRATFLPLETLRPSPPRGEEAGLGRRPEALGWASELVACPARLELVASYLLGRVLVAGDLPSALALARAAGYRYRVVTLDGEMIHPGGAVTGGSQPGAGGGERGGLLVGRAGEVERLASAVAAARAELEALERERAELRERLRRAREAEKESLLALERAEGGLARAGQELATTEGEARQVAERLAALAFRREGAERELRDLLAEAGGVGAPDPAAHAQREAALRAEARALEEALAPAATARAALAERLVQERVALASLEQEIQGRRRWLEGLAARRQEAEREIAAREQALAEAQARRDRREREAAEAAREAAARDAERAAVEERLAELRRRREDGLAALAAAEAACRRGEEEVRRLEERLHAAQVEEARVAAEARALFDLLAERYGRGEEEALRLPDESPRALEERAQRLRAEVEELGPVNPRAPQAYEAERQRADALRAAIEDLEGARARLESLAARIAVRLEEVFGESLERVRRHFQEVFARLFGGGQADLVRTEREGAPAGVEVVVQPPGKRPQHLALLSGGERALAAIALLFALLRERPAPFCVLDEIDAALDEANAQRFARFLREAASGGRDGSPAQFIVITHQKVTMEVADRLYGVTMDETGCSRLVSLRLVEVSA